MSKEQSSTKKHIAQKFLELTEKGKVKEAFDLYVAEDFRHHNPHFKGDRATMISVMEKTAKRFSDLESKRYNVVQDGNLVAIHSHIKPLPKNQKDAGLSYVHIFRFDKNKIVELWDFGQPVPNAIVNENGMF
jgi:predicted SnoaL-like aldol condensation-catalyzing enzyme